MKIQKFVRWPRFAAVSRLIVLFPPIWPWNSAIAYLIVQQLHTMWKFHKPRIPFRTMLLHWGILSTKLSKFMRIFPIFPFVWFLYFSFNWICIYRVEATSKLFISFKANHFIALNRTAAYTLTDFIAGCGGFLGLFMGIAIFSKVWKYGHSKFAGRWGDGHLFKEK